MDRAEARDAITRLIYDYARALDAGDLERVGDLFAHAVIGGDAGDVRGREAAIGMYRDHTQFYDSDHRPAEAGEPGVTPCTRHMTTNLIIDLDDDGLTATCHSYVVVFMSLPDFPLQPIVRGVYRDRFECVDGIWRFSERLMEMDDVGDVSRHLKINPYAEESQN